MKERLTKVNIIGDAFYHRFKTNLGQVVYVEITKAEYDALALPNPINPTRPDATWVCSFSRRKLDTPSEYIEKGQYFVDGESAVVFPVGDDNETGVHKSKIVADEIDLTELALIKNEAKGLRFPKTADIQIIPKPQ